MNRDEIEKLEAGRELDALVAEKVMGLGVSAGVWTDTKKNDYGLTETAWTRTVGVLDSDKHGVGYHHEVVTTYEAVNHYSTDIAAAWEVVDAICIPAPEGCWTGPTFQLNHDKSEPEATQWQAIFSNLDSLDGVKSWSGEQFTDVHADTAPLAICRAALLAVTS
jgi:hypothetical protein